MNKTLTYLTLVARGVDPVEAGKMAGLTRSGARGVLSLYRRGIRTLTFTEFTQCLTTSR